MNNINNDIVNPVGGEDEIRTETDNANSGSTHCSFLRFAAITILTRISSTLRSLILGVFGCLQSIDLALEDWLKTDEEKDWEMRFRAEYRRR